MQAKAPARLIEGGMATTAFISHIVVGEIRLVFDALSPDADSCRLWRHHRPSDVGSLDQGSCANAEEPV